MVCQPKTPLEKMIIEAETAYHKLQTGVSVVEIVDQNGERVRFNPGNRQDLYNYIQRLRARLPADQLCLAPNNGPAGFFF